MVTTLLTEERANKIYDLLIEIGGASVDERTGFIYHHCESTYGCSEWRFRGKLGCGGKYRSRWNGVTYYPESETPKMKSIRDRLNIELSRLNNE
jgi:hypothetical protein